MHKLDRDFKSQIKRIPGAAGPRYQEDDRLLNCSSTRSSAIMMRHSADAGYGNHSLENKLAMGAGRNQGRELDHMRSHFGG